MSVLIDHITNDMQYKILSDTIHLVKSGEDDQMYENGCICIHIVIVYRDQLVPFFDYLNGTASMS